MKERIIYILESGYDSNVSIYRQYFEDEYLAEEIQTNYVKHKWYYVNIISEKLYITNEDKVYRMVEVGKLFDDEKYYKEKELKDSIKTKLSEEELKYLQLI